MRTAVAPTSLAAFRSLRADGLLQPQQLVVLDAIRKWGPMTREELAVHTGLRLSAICGRVGALIKLRELEERGTRPNPQSGKANKLVCLPVMQRRLFE